MLEQMANGRLESVLSKQFYVLHFYQTQLGNECFIFDGRLGFDARVEHSPSPGQGLDGIFIQRSRCQ